MQEIELKTGVWYNDRTVRLTFPNEWEVAAYWPDTPPPLSDDEIARRLASPVAQPPIAQLAQGKKKPLIVVDDLSRPTPVSRILPHVLGELESAGLDLSQLRILVATGTHGKQDPDALANKLGRATVDKFEIVIHNDKGKVALVGETSFGTPVYVNPVVIDSDLIIGISGVYPQHSTGFGGGGKLALGVMGRRTIKHLHFGHPAVGGNYNIDNDFRRNVTEMAQMIGLRTIVTVHIDARQEVVGVMSGDYTVYYDDAARCSRQVYDAPAPTDADAVIANGYPSDVSYTFMRKGNKPVLCAPAGATRIMVGSNHGGLGHHGLYPQGKNPRVTHYKELWDRVSIMEPGVVIKKILKNLFHRKRPASSPAPETKQAGPREEKMWVYVPPGGRADLPVMKDVEVLTSWDEVLDLIRKEHPGKEKLKVRIYPCAPLQCIDA